MYITRIQIEDGFLDGLDVNFAPGLNVVIGARGTGKTSLIELIRFCLGADANTPETARKSRDHALSVLGAGQITLTLVGDTGEIYISRAASDLNPRSSGTFLQPIIFSQTEIETIGLQANGRLQLIDSFMDENSASEFEHTAIAEFSSLNVEMDKIRRELEEIDRQVAGTPAIEAEIKAIAHAEAALSQTSLLIATKSSEIERLSKAISEQGVMLSEGERINHGIAVWYEQVTSVIASPPVVVTPASHNYFPYIADDVSKVKESLTQATNVLSAAYHKLKAATDSAMSEKVKKEDQARLVRKEIDGLSEGAGQILRKGQQLREQQAKLLSIAEYQKVKRVALDNLLLKRDSILDRLDATRNIRFQARRKIVDLLNQRLGPRIRINILRNAQVHAFAAAIADTLKGSNLRYADVARDIATNLTPRALLEAVDAFDIELICRVANISSDRAARVLSHLRGTDLGAIGCFEIEDNVAFQLLDGKDFKDFGSLSTGQRCTVILPLVLAHQNNLIVVDQPEDHIDNAFIADTLIKAILARDVRTQIIFTTHNPNIPVLGNADHVIHMSSDGRRGFCSIAGNLDHPEIVEAISNVMEGGADAFSKRSNFYSILDLI